MDEAEKQLFTKRNVVSFLVVAILILVIPFGVNLIETQTRIRSQAAAGDAINFAGDNVKCEVKNGKEECLATDDTVNIEFKYGQIGSATVPPALGASISLASGGQEITIQQGQTITFNVASGGLNPSQHKLNAYVTKIASPNIIPENCPANKIVGNNKEWCLLSLGSASSYPNVSWTAPTNASGTYFIEVNMDLNDPNTAATVFHCTGNPWCEWPGKGACGVGSNCDTQCKARYNWSDCGDNDFIKVVVN